MRKNRKPKIDKMLIISALVFVVGFIMILKFFVFDGGEEKVNNKELPQFEKEEKVIEQIEAEGLFRGMFGSQYVDIKVGESIMMFTYEEAVKEKLEKMKLDDEVSFVYLNNVDEKEKKILSIDILQESKVKEEEQEEVVDRNKMIKSLYARGRIIETEGVKTVVYEIYNDAPMEQTIYFQSGKQFELLVKDKEGKVVYDNAKNYTFADAETEITIDRGGKHVFEAELEKLDKGEYTVEMWVTSQNTDDLKHEEKLIEKNGKEKMEKEKELTVKTKDGEKKIPANLTKFDQEAQWYVLKGTSFNGSKLNGANYATTISLAQKGDIEKERWDAAEKLKKEGTLAELDNKLPTDEFVFFVEKSSGDIHEISVKNINGTMYRFETVYTMAWTNSRHEIEAMVETIG